MTDYDVDFLLWANEQASLLRDGRLADVDRMNIAEELETLARALQRELTERLVRLLQNLLQWEYLPLVRLPAWYIAVQEERAAIPLLLADAPCLRDIWLGTYAVEWQLARKMASDATGLALTVIPLEPTYTREQALDAAFWPGDGGDRGSTT